MLWHGLCIWILKNFREHIVWNFYPFQLFMYYCDILWCGVFTNRLFEKRLARLYQAQHSNTWISGESSNLSIAFLSIYRDIEKSNLRYALVIWLRIFWFLYFTLVIILKNYWIFHPRKILPYHWKYKIPSLKQSNANIFFSNEVTTISFAIEIFAIDQILLLYHMHTS